MVEEHHPDLCVVDIRMPPTYRIEGIGAARAIRERSPEIAIGILLSAHVHLEPATVEAARDPQPSVPTPAASVYKSMPC